LKTKHITRYILLSLLVFFIAPQAIKAQRAIDYIDISNPFLRKVPIAVPLFKYTPESVTARQISETSTNLATEALDFTGFFKMLDRRAFLVDLQKVGITSSALNFQSWTTVGAELLITGGVKLQDNLVVLEMRLFDTFSGRLLVGKKYKGWKTDLRRMIRRFCNEVILRLTGSQGFFESKIAFTSNGTGNKEIYICDYDGHNIIRVTRNKTINLSPAWSSDGIWIAYTSFKKKKPDIYIWNLKEKYGKVVDFVGSNITPAWRPGRFSMAAALSKHGNSEIYLLTGTGNIIKRLTFNWGIDVSPTWSPDGKKIAFVSNRSGSAQIYIKDLETTRISRLTFEGQYNSSPSWSPRGDKIAYAGRSNEVFNIYVINTDGSRLIQLTRNSGNNESPTWSPDGNLIAYSSTKNRKTSIYVMTSYGTDQRQLLKMSGNQTEPCWSPK